MVGILALGAAIALLYQDYSTWKRGGDSFIDWSKWEPGITAAGKGLKWLGDIAKDTIGILGKATGWLEKKAASDPVLNSLNQSTVRKTGNAAMLQNYFQKQGWTKEQASGIAANLMSESGGRANATGDGGKAYGLGQWHPDRQAAFKARFGHDIRQSTLDEQLQFVQFELTQGAEQGAGNRLRGAKTAGEAGALSRGSMNVPGCER